MLQKLAAHSKAYWLLLIAAGLSLEGVALYFQYGLDYGPCVLCTHIRAWILGLIMVAVAGLALSGSRLAPLPHLLSVPVAAALVERSWLTLGIERGFIEGSCTMDSGYPAWLALDRWWPTVFEPWEPCGYTPELLFGVTMAEALIVLMVMLLLVTLLMTASSIKAVQR